MNQSWYVADFPFGIDAVELRVQDQVGVVAPAVGGDSAPMPHLSPSG